LWTDSGHHWWTKVVSPFDRSVPGTLLPFSARARLAGLSSPCHVALWYASEQQGRSFVAVSQVPVINADLRTISLEWIH
jgi:hypothetical protein